MSNAHDAGIPMLTEIITDSVPLSSEKQPASPAPQVAIPSVVPTEPEAVAAPRTMKPEVLTQEQFSRLEQEIRERVLQQVLERIDYVLELRVRDSLADVLQTAVDHLAAEIRSGLQQSIKEVVARAVANELAKVQSAKN